jgi:hypothetical protein
MIGNSREPSDHGRASLALPAWVRDEVELTRRGPERLAAGGLCGLPINPLAPDSLSDTDTKSLRLACIARSGRHTD